MKKLPDIKDYCCDVVAHLENIRTEDDSLLRDLAGTGAEVEVRRAAMYKKIRNNLDEGSLLFYSAMRIAEVPALNTARVVYVMNLTDKRSSNGRL